MDTVMARASPRKRALSKNITSPTAMATTMETTRRRKLVSPMAASRRTPPVARTQVRRRLPPKSARTALTVTELKGGDTVRTRRLVTAHVNAEARAQIAPRVGRERKSTTSRYQRARNALRYCGGDRLRLARRPRAPRAHPAPRPLARHPYRAPCQHPLQPGRDQGRRPSGLLDLGGQPHDRALLPRPARRRRAGDQG